MAQPELSMATRGLDSQIGGGGGKIEGRHILIIALSEHHVDYMNPKRWSLCYYVGEHFHRCVYRIAWQTLISIAEVRKRNCSEI